MAMRRPASIMIAVGMPGPHGGEQDGDEDNLQREREGNGRDIAEEGICGIAETLVRGGPPAIRAVRLLARGLEDMAQAAMKKDNYAQNRLHSGALSGHSSKSLI